MTSKFEVLEFLRVNGETRLKDIEEAFKWKDNPGTARRAVYILRDQGLVKGRRHFSKEEPTALGFERKLKKDVKDHRKGKPVWYKLTDRAWNWLKDKDVESFLDLPSARRRERKMMKRDSEKYKRTFVKIR